ncbi:MAG: hypothetical protein HC910_21580 [Spirulinaceae cyanobacterium SM2_1_0]|nr:hypothetical protein [Spirulinaceae cyanobacterium SM2_1_0]
MNRHQQTIDDLTRVREALDRQIESIPPAHDVPSEIFFTRLVINNLIRGFSQQT